MAQNELTRACCELSRTVAERYGANPDHSALINELLRAFGALGYQALEAGRSERCEATAAWREAHRACQNVLYWLSLCGKAGLIPENEELPLQKRLTALQRKLKEAQRASSERDERRRIEKAGQVRFQSARLCFRSPLAADREGLLLLSEDAAYRDSSLPCCSDEEEAKAALRRWEAESDVLIIAHHSDGRMVGYLRLIPDGASGERKRLELAILPAYRRRGYAAEALEATLAFLFRAKDTPTVAAYLPCDSLFLPCLRRFGFREEGMLRRYGQRGEDLLAMSVGKDDPTGEKEK